MRKHGALFSVGTAGDGKLRRSKAAQEETVCSWDEADSVVSKINAYSDEPHRSRRQPKIAASPSSLGADVSPPREIYDGENGEDRHNEKSPNERLSRCGVQSALLWDCPTARSCDHIGNGTQHIHCEQSQVPAAARGDFITS
jgi:hypothetical protein